VLAVSRPGAGYGKPDPFLGKDGYQSGAVSFPVTLDSGFEVLSVPNIVLLGMGQRSIKVKEVDSALWV